MNAWYANRLYKPLARELGLNGSPRACTFLDPDNRLRYPPVSLFFVMRWCWRLAPVVQETLFDHQFALIHVGVDGRFVGLLAL